MRTRDRSKVLTLAQFVALLVALFVALFTPILAGPARAQADATSLAHVDVRYVTVGTHFFAPNTFAFRAGEPLRLVVTNGSRHHLHDVLIVAGDSLSLAGEPSAVIREGETITVDWTPPGPGIYRLLCAICGPDEMIAVIVVS